MSLRLSHNRFGRALLHLACILAGGNRGWHWKGIRRELRLRPMEKSQP